MQRLGLILGVAAIGLAIGGYVFFNGERKEPVRYRTAGVERGDVVSVVSATGTINPVVSVQVGTQVSGMIKSLHADFNTQVKAVIAWVFLGCLEMINTGFDWGNRCEPSADRFSNTGH